MEKSYHSVIICFLNADDLPDAININVSNEFEQFSADEGLFLQNFIEDMGGEFLVSYSTQSEIDILTLALKNFNKTQKVEEAPEKTLKKVTVSGVDFMFPVDFDCSFDYIPSINYDDNGNPENLSYERVEEFLKVIGYLEPENSMIAQIEKGDFFIHLPPQNPFL
jgi:hypothetical protein